MFIYIKIILILVFLFFIDKNTFSWFNFIMVKFVEESNFKKNYQNLILPYINKRRSNGYFNSENATKLFYSFFKADKERGAVILLHGYTESIEKYLELIYYFLQDGLSVYAYDQRGHGKSTRVIEDYSLVHVDSYKSYLLDLEFFIEYVIPKKEIPLYAYAHSMGGAVMSLYLEKGYTKIKKVILNAPLHGLATPKIPPFLTKIIIFPFAVFSPRKKAFFIKKHPYYKPFEKSNYTSLARYENYENFRQNTLEYTTCAGTNKWIYQSLKAVSKIMKNGNVEKINVPVQIYSAEFDKTVDNVSHVKFVKRLRYGTYKLIKNAKHDNYNSTNIVLKPYVLNVLSYLK